MLSAELYAEVGFYQPVQSWRQALFSLGTSLNNLGYSLEADPLRSLQARNLEILIDVSPQLVVDLEAERFG